MNLLLNVLVIYKELSQFLTELGRLGIKIGKNFKKYSIDLNHASVQSQTGLESNIITIAKKPKLKINVISCCLFYLDKILHYIQLLKELVILKLGFLIVVPF